MCFYVRIADGLVLSRQWNQLGLAMGARSAALVYRLLLCQVIIMDLSSSSLHFIVIVSVMLVASGCLHILMSIVSCVCGDSIELQ